jgi:hypothetical protein
MPAIVTESGDIQIHGREGASLVFEFTDDADAPRDMTAATVTFEIEGFTKGLTPGAAPHLMVLQIQRGELPNTIGKVVEFVVIDETDTVPHVIWSGNLIQVGWR